MKKIIYICIAVLLSSFIYSGVFAQTTSSYSIGVPDMQKFCWGGHYVDWYVGPVHRYKSNGVFFQNFTHLRFFYTDNGSQASNVSTHCIPFDQMEPDRTFQAYASEGWVNIASPDEYRGGNMDGVDRCANGDTLLECKVKVLAASTSMHPYWNDTDIWELNYFGEFEYLTNKFSYTPPLPATTTTFTGDSDVALVINAFSKLFGSTVNSPDTDTRLLNDNSYGSASLTFMKDRILIVLGSGLGVFSTILPYILALIIIMAIVYFFYRAFRFMRH